MPEAERSQNQEAMDPDQEVQLLVGTPVRREGARSVQELAGWFRDISTALPPPVRYAEAR